MATDTLSGFPLLGSCTGSVAALPRRQRGKVRSSAGKKSIDARGTKSLSQSFPLLVVALPVCLAVVVLSAGYFVRGAVSIAHRLSIPEFLVGSVIVAVGTSAPEVAINVSAAREQAGDLLVSNIVGSNIVNISLGVGIAGLMFSFDRARREYVATILVGGLGALILLGITLFTANAEGQSIFPRTVGFGLLFAFAAFMYFSIKSADGSDDEIHEPDVGWPLAIIFVLLGALAMAYFSELAVRLAVDLSHLVGIPEAVIGATVIAAGGSLPEVSSCIAAARIRRPNLILGNVAGSQIFNMLGILGLSGVITTFSYSSRLAVDMMILLAMTLVLLVCIRFSRVRPALGPALVIGYVVYALYLVAIST